MKCPGPSVAPSRYDNGAAKDADAAAMSRHPAIDRFIYRFAPAIVALGVFLAFSAIYLTGHQDAYMAALRFYGIDPFRFPFLDIGGSLAAWDCSRLGIDVIQSDPCDVLKRGYTYSPLWMDGAFIPLGSGARGVVGWILGLLFLLSLTLLPPARRPCELALVILATISTMVVFAVERANPDTIIFMLALLVGFLARRPHPARLLAYVIALFAAMVKYYPITLLILMFRERVSAFLGIGVALAIPVAAFLAVYLPEIERGFPFIPSGSYNTDLFGAKNLPSQIASFFLGRVDGSPATPPFDLVAGGLYVLIVLAGALVCRRLLIRTPLRAALLAIRDPEGMFLIGGCVLIVGCFFAGQNVAYRGIFLLFVLPGLLAIGRGTADAGLRRIMVATAIVLVSVMWGEFFRRGLLNFLGIAAFSPLSRNLLYLAYWLVWLVRELAWWGMISVMVAILLSFLADARTVRAAWQAVGRYRAR